MPDLHFTRVSQTANVSSFVRVEGRMEGAGASNVSHAAETRGMDSADKEPELSCSGGATWGKQGGHAPPSPGNVYTDCELQNVKQRRGGSPPSPPPPPPTRQVRPLPVRDLLLRLEGKGEPIKKLPKLRGAEFRDLYRESASLSANALGYPTLRSKVRVRMLEAIGNCNTLESLDLRDICGGRISSLKESEWEVALRGFISSTVLRVIAISYLHWRKPSEAEVESLCLQIGRILNSSSVEHLTIDDCRLSGRCFSNLTSGLRGNSESKLKSLNLYRAWKDSSAVKHVADMISSATRLETLSINGNQICGEVIDEETVGILSQALMQSSSLKQLDLGRVDWGATLLLKALAGDDSNRSIERLGLERMDGLGGCLRELLTSNPSLKEVTLRSVRMSPEEWNQLGQVIRDNARATKIRVVFGKRQYIEGTQNWESIEALVCAASSDVKEPTVELVLEPSVDDELILSLKLLGKVLQGEINSLKSFCISTRYTILTSISPEIPDCILPMNGKSGEISVLKGLKLYVESNTFWKGFWKDLLWCLRGNTSLTHLDLSDNALDEKAFRDLMGLLEVNLTLQEIDVSGTSWVTDGKAALIQEVLKNNQKRAETIFATKTVVNFE